MLYKYKANLVLMFITLVLLPLQAIASCPDNIADLQSFRTFWGQLIKTVNQKDPQKLITYYQFPVEISGPWEKDRSISLSQKAFIQYYQDIFLTQPGVSENLFDKEAKRYLTDDFEQYAPIESYFKNGCLSKSNKNYFYLGMFGFKWSQTSGWKVTSISHGDYYEVKDFLRSKKALFFWKNPKK